MWKPLSSRSRAYSVLGIVWLFSTVSLRAAQPTEQSSIKGRPPFAIPIRQGSITSYDPGKQQTPRQLVVIIQDLHANVGVQKNIASILYRRTKVMPAYWFASRVPRVRATCRCCAVCLDSFVTNLRPCSCIKPISLGRS